MSPREQTAHTIAEWINGHRLNSPFGGDVSKSSDGRYYGVLFAYPRYLDGLVRVYGPNFILIETQGPWVRGQGRRLYESTENALAFLQAAFVEHDWDKAENVPMRKERAKAKGAA